MNAFYLILGSEGALSDRAVSKLTVQLKESKCEITNLFAGETIVGDIADALAPSLFSERRALILRDLQDLPEDNRDEITRYLQSPDESMTVVFVHKGVVKGKALLDAIKKVNPEIISCEPLKKEAEKEAFVKEQFLDIGRKATPGAVAAVVGALGSPGCPSQRSGNWNRSSHDYKCNRIRTALFGQSFRCQSQCKIL